jgi:dienelactone hydrolase
MLSGLAAGLTMTASAAAETVSFDVTTLTDPTIALVAELQKPEGPGPFAAVVMLHGCGGVWWRWGDAWSRRLVGWGYVTLRVDSFKPRGYPRGVCNSPGAVGPLTRTADAHTAKAYLAALPYVDERRIAVLGMSHGGWTTLWAVQNPFSDIAPRSDPFKAAVAIYPPCETQLTRLDAPLLILIGGADDWTLAARCESMKAVGPTGHAVTLKVYPGATHAFDAEGPDFEVMGHVMKYHPAASRDAVARVRAFLATHLAGEDR